MSSIAQLMLGNKYNWWALPRAAYVFVDPLRIALALVRGRLPPMVTVRSPIGHLRIALRNFEGFRTLFSISRRRDYFTPTDRPGAFLDIGANVGLATLYFLSRHPQSTARCYEPDSANLEVLKRTADGKYSSLLASEKADTPQTVTTIAFDTVLAEAVGERLPVTIKLDIEGKEVDLVRAVKFENYVFVRRLICESLDHPCASAYMQEWLRR
jgi:hypothetical protein